MVGDDAQSIYSFRGATVRNILDFPKQFPGTTVVQLEENYRSTEPILEATNTSHRPGLGGLREGASVQPDGGRASPAGRVRRRVRRGPRSRRADSASTRRTGIPLRQQAVLFRASHHSLAVEMELARRQIPFHKYGGLKFAEAAHVKDLVAFLRLAENPRDVVSGLRLFKLLPGIGPKKAQGIMDGLVAAGGNLDCLARVQGAGGDDPVVGGRSVTLLRRADQEPCPWGGRPDRQVLKFFTPLVRQTYDDPEQRLEDLREAPRPGRAFRGSRRVPGRADARPAELDQDLAAASAPGARTCSC